jgi:hypothetical protein
MTRLTRLAHDAVRATLAPGAFAVDATAGNGHDTLFLAQAVGPGGRVLAFDIQAAAIRATRARLEAHGCAEQVDLVEGCHSALAGMLPGGRPIRAAMFNLGYLPGSDKQSITGFATTQPALEACLAGLDQQGIVSVMAYRGHPRGDEEADAVAAFFGGLPGQHFSVERDEAPGSGPVLWLIRPVNVRR